MTRCGYIPSDGESVIAIATERGGTTDGDIQALRDRFGCKTEATHRLLGDPNKNDDIYACRDHVGHLIGDRPRWVDLVEPVDLTISIVNTAGVALDGFGSPMILAPSPASTPVVDLGTNPTREQLEAAGFRSAGAAYREARAAFDDRPDDARALIERDRLLYGTGFGRQHPGGTLEHIPAAEMIVVHRTTPRTGWGDVIQERARRSWAPSTPFAVGDQIESDGATWQVARSGTGAVLSSGNVPLTLHSAIVKPGHDGSSAMLWISTPINASQIAILKDWSRRSVLIRVDAEIDPYAIVEMTYAGGAHEAWTMTLVLKRLHHRRPRH